MNPVVMGFQIQICSILHFSWSILVNCCVHLWTSSRKTQMLLLQKNIFHKYWQFCDRFIMFTFDLCLSFVNNAQKMLLHRPISTYDRILDWFYVISMEFLSLESRTFLLAKRAPSGDEQGEMSVFAGYPNTKPTKIQTNRKQGFRREWVKMLCE